MDEIKFEKWFDGFKEDFTLRQKERIAKMAWLRCRGTFDGNKILKIHIRREDLEGDLPC